MHMAALTNDPIERTFELAGDALRLRSQVARNFYIGECETNNPHDNRLDELVDEFVDAMYDKITGNKDLPLTDLVEEAREWTEHELAQQIGLAAYEQIAERKNEGIQRLLGGKIIRAETLRDVVPEGAILRSVHDAVAERQAGDAVAIGKFTMADTAKGRIVLEQPATELSLTARERRERRQGREIDAVYWLVELFQNRNYGVRATKLDLLE